MSLTDFAYPFDNVRKGVIINLSIHLLVASIIALIFIPYYDEIYHYFVIASWIFINDVTQAIGHIKIYFFLEEKFDWIKGTVKRAVNGVFFHLLITFAIYFPVNIFCLYIIFDFSVGRSIETLINTWYIPVGIVIFVMTFTGAIQFLKNWKKSLTETEKIRTELMSYKYDSLLNQINPHFLFNSFNVLANLVYENPDLAEKFIHQLSAIYRNVIENRDKELISINEELKFIKSYIFLLKIRFEDKLQITLDLKPDIHDLIVPMVLQTLIENAVKHNTISKAKPLKISISRVRNNIEVRNNLQAKRSNENSLKTGIQNIKQRYSFFTDKEVAVINNSEEFIVSIPILNNDE